MELWLALGAFYAFSAGLYVVARADDVPLRDRGLVHVPVVALWWFLAGWVVFAIFARTGPVAGAAGATGLVGALIALAIGIAITVPYWSFLLGLMAERGLRAATGVDGMTVERTYDRAEKAEKERRWEEALALYLAAAGQAPDEPEPLRRAGEVELAMGRDEDAVRHLRQALARTKPPEDVASLSFRIAEVLVRRLERREEAGAVLEETARRLAGTKFESYARERLAQLG